VSAAPGTIKHDQGKGLAATYGVLEKNGRGAVLPNTTKLVRDLACAKSKRGDDSYCQASTPVDSTWPQRKRTTNLEKSIWRRRCGQQDTSPGLEEDGGGSTEQS